jgi:hypothetical protein
MTVYPTSTNLTSPFWAAPIEPIWHMLPPNDDPHARWKRPDLGVSDRLFIGAILNLPTEKRPWGVVQWLADVYHTSRPTLYAIGERTQAGLRNPLLDATKGAEQKAAAVAPDERQQVHVTRNRINRTALTLLFPGGVSERSAADCLQAALDVERSPAYLSGLLNEAGQRAGAILQAVDHSALGAVMQARDELFVGRDPILLLVEPHSLTITGLYATTDRDADTWGCVLLFTQDRGVHIQGLAEDNCIPYAASCRAAQLDTAIQKDVWHPLADVGKVIGDVERDALRQMEAVAKLEKRLGKQWDAAVFDQWVQADAAMTDLLRQSQHLRGLRGALWEAVELVDWRNGDIRTRAINQWLAEEALREMRQLPHPRIQKLTERLASVLPEMLTFLDHLAPDLDHWQARAEEHFHHPLYTACLQASVARLWRLEHALRNGHPHFRAAAREAEQWLALWIDTDPAVQPLAEQLLSLLERTVRTSSAAETINSVLRPYLDRRRECTDLVSRQCFLNLFTLWFNLHKFERGPRKGKCPYELAGIDLGTTDWLTLLGFPPD